MADVAEVIKLKILTGGTNDELLNLLIDDAESFVLAYTNRKSLPDVLKKPVRDLALIAYNRMGTEGENSRSEAGENYSFNDAPKQVYDVLNRYRLARVGGVTYEAKAEQG